MFPKASDKTFEEKLKTNHLGKTSTFGMPKKGDAHFAVSHYAGKNYGCQNSFLQLFDKNKLFCMELDNIFGKKKKEIIFLKTMFGHKQLMSSAAHQFGRVEYCISNICYYFLQADVVEKSK